MAINSIRFPEKPQKMICTHVANMLLYEPNEKDPAFTQRAIKMLTILFMAARIAEVSPFVFVREVSKYGVNTLAKYIHEINQELGRRLVDGDYNPKKDYRESKFLVDSWESLTAQTLPVFNRNSCQLNVRLRFSHFRSSFIKTASHDLFNMAGE